jgi:uncharacterized membrane protein YebE (DUF533 family)
MLKGKNLYYVLGLGAVAYYFYWMNKKNKAAKVISAPAATNFTGNLGVTDYENASGFSKYSKASAKYPSGLNKTGQRLSGF